MKEYNLRTIGLSVIIIGIGIFIIGGVIDVNTSEEYERIEDTNEHENTHEEARKVADERRLAIWLMGLSQILIFSGIGIIIFDIAENRTSNDTPKKHDSEKKVKKQDSESKNAFIKCPACKTEIQIDKPKIGSVLNCPFCNKKFKLKPPSE